MTLKDITEHQNQSETADFVNFQQELKSILFDCWIEAINQQDGGGKQKINLIKEASVPTLSVIIELLLIIQDSHKEEKLMLGITKNFPFEMLPTTKKEKTVDIEELNLNICLLVLNTNEYEEMVTKYLSNFQVNSSGRASQVASILLKMPRKKNQDLHPIIHQLATKFAYNENVANLMLVLSSDENESVVNVWIESLPDIISSAKVTKSHLEAIRMLFKRRNEVMLTAFQNMVTLRKCVFYPLSFFPHFLLFFFSSRIIETIGTVRPGLESFGHFEALKNSRRELDERHPKIYHEF